MRIHSFIAKWGIGADGFLLRESSFSFDGKYVACLIDIFEL